MFICTLSRHASQTEFPVGTLFAITIVMNSELRWWCTDTRKPESLESLLLSKQSFCSVSGPCMWKSVRWSCWIATSPVSPFHRSIARSKFTSLQKAFCVPCTKRAWNIEQTMLGSKKHGKARLKYRSCLKQTAWKWKMCPLRSISSSAGSRECNKFTFDFRFLILDFRFSILDFRISIISIFDLRFSSLQNKTIFVRAPLSSQSPKSSCKGF